MRRPLSKQIFAHCVFGTQPIYLADQIFVARRRGEDVEAFHSGRRCGGLARAVGPTQGEGEGGRGGTLPSSPSKRPGWTASGSTAFCRAKESKVTLSRQRSILTARRRRRAKTDGIDGIDGHAFSLQTRGTAGVRDGQGADIRRRRPPPDLLGARDARWRASGTRQPDQMAALRPMAARCRRT